MFIAIITTNTTGSIMQPLLSHCYMQDLAARNIMLGRDERCKVGDFGLLRRMGSTQGSEQLAYIPQSSTPIFIRWMAHLDSLSGNLV